MKILYPEFMRLWTLGIDIVFVPAKIDIRGVATNVVVLRLRSRDCKMLGTHYRSPDKINNIGPLL